jgi:hypothetical protein
MYCVPCHCLHAICLVRYIALIIYILTVFTFCMPVQFLRNPQSNHIVPVFYVIFRIICHFWFKAMHFNPSQHLRLVAIVCAVRTENY